MKPAHHFEWTFSTRVKERNCSSCRAKTSAFLTNLKTGVRRPLCSTCFFDAMKAAAPSLAPRKQPSSVSLEQTTREEQLRLC